VWIDFAYSCDRHNFAVTDESRNASFGYFAFAQSTTDSFANSQSNSNTIADASATNS
jgi:hypothetical protein